MRNKISLFQRNIHHTLSIKPYLSENTANKCVQWAKKPNTKQIHGASKKICTWVEIGCGLVWFSLPHIFLINSLRPRPNRRHFADDTFKLIFLTENVRISINISLKFVPKGPINNNPALVQIMAWRRSGDKPLSEPMMVSLLTHICVTRPKWVNFTGNGVRYQRCNPDEYR